MNKEQEFIALAQEKGLLGKHGERLRGENLTESLAVAMADMLGISASYFAVLCEKVFGYSGGMCEIVRDWIMESRGFL